MTTKIVIAQIQANTKTTTMTMMSTDDELGDDEHGDETALAAEEV
jgi:ribosomal protein L18